MKTEKSNNKIKTIFMGTPEFAVPGLLSLIESKYFNVIAVYTQPDKPKGRKKELSQPPIKEVAIKNNIPVFQPTKIKPEIDTIKQLSPDLIVVIAYGKIIPQAILDIPKYACINVHASLLPKYRGASCLNAPILNGDKETGISIMKMDANMDTGPILKQFSIPLSDKSTLEEVHDQLKELAAKHLPETLISWVNNEIEAKEQNNNIATYVKLTKKEDGKIDWSKNAIEIDRQIRAYTPWPGAFTYLENGKLLKISSAKVINTLDTKEAEKMIPGHIFIEKNELYVRCGQAYLNILKLQTEGSRIMRAFDFLSGHQDINGQTLN